MEITIGYSIPKPVATQAECDCYTAMVQAVAEHNAACAVGNTLWFIEDQAERYAVADGGPLTEPEPAPDPEPTSAELAEQITALQSAQTDTDALTVDQEYRLTLLELGVSE